MQSILSLSPSQRAELFNAASQKLGIHAVMIEKDFWVCWTLKQLFSFPSVRDNLIFKGGTSLSKVWKAIQRFSEDIDISFSRSWLGFGGDKDPEDASSKKQRKQRMDSLQEACALKLSSEVLPLLEKTAKEKLQGEKWLFYISPEDPQTLFFRYPTVLMEGAIGYIPREVKIEAGARSDDWPCEEAQVQPYVTDAFESQITNSKLTVRALSIERTFWEKATILHAEAHRPADKPTPPRFSRHYSDLAMLALSKAGEHSIHRDDLRERVVAHKKVFFASAWASYNTAIPGQFKLIPSPERLKALEQDYRDMQQMFYGDAMSWSSVFKTLLKLESVINLSAGS